MSDLDENSFDQWLDEDEQVPASRPARRHVAAEPPRQSRRTKPARRSGWDRWKLVLIPAAALLLAAVIVLGVGFAYADRIAKITTIYPNVSVNGVAVGGMTVEEAAQVLGDDPNRYANAAVTVNFPTGESVTVTAQDLGLQAVDGTEYARLAYSYGRSGTMISNLMAYRACESQPVDIAASRSGPVIDQTVISALVEPVAQQVDEKLSTVQAAVGENEITLVKNTGALKVDVPAVCAMVADAFLAENYAPIQYELTAQPETEAMTAEERDALLQSVYDHIFVAPEDARYDQATGGVVEAVTGVSFDMEQARQLWDETAEGGNVVIPIVRQAPAVTADQLTGQLFADVLAEKSTTLSGSTSARINNITLAAAAMNGTILQPGEEFNYNACLGQRTAEKGYQSAGAFSGGKHIMSIGGGICQGSSTLYYCALKANLAITDRWCHQFVVNYLPRGMDATVSWGWPDFKFVNSRTYPIKIEAYVSGGYLTVRILGTDVDGSYVEITNDTWEDATHYYAQTYRNVYDRNGNLISSTKEAYSSYDKEEAVAAASTTQETVQQPVQQPAQQPSDGGTTAPPVVPETVPETVPDTQTQTQPDTQTQPETQPEVVPDNETIPDTQDTPDTPSKPDTPSEPAPEDQQQSNEENPSE